jgi:hypothetical protein
MKTFNKVDLKLKALYRFKYNFILNCNVFSVRECVQSCGVSHTNLDETLAFADHKRSEVEGRTDYYVDGRFLNRAAFVVGYPFTALSLVVGASKCPKLVVSHRLNKQE